MDLKVSVMGAGIWGTVIADMLAKKGCEVRLWCHESELVKQINSKHVNSIYFNDGVIHDGVTAVHDKQSCMEADVIVNAVPVQFIRRTWTSLKPGEEVPLINLSKGIEQETLDFPVNIISSVTGKRENIFVLSGPSFAREVYQECYTAVVLAGKKGGKRSRMQRLFSSDSMRVYTHGDMTGVELAGAMKNVMAIGAGMVKGISAGSNTQAAIITRGVAEVMRLGRSMGASEETFTGLAGFGDFILTCTNEQSRNFTFGKCIAGGCDVKEATEKAGGVVEGFHTLKSAHQLSERYDCELPITEAIYSIVCQGHEISAVIGGLMKRTLKEEWT